MKTLNLDYTKKNFQNQLINIVLVLNLFFRFIEHFEFVCLINMFKSNVKISRRTRFEKMIKIKYKKIKKTILKNLKITIRINIALNNWISSNNIVFMTIIDYFIDENLKYREMLFAFESFTEAHIDKMITKKVLLTLKSFQIQNINVCKMS
jgi:hypothetical protein